MHAPGPARVWSVPRQGAYFAVLADPAIGGTYMTLLNTFSNLGATWPRYLVMAAVEYWTVHPCIGAAPKDDAAAAAADALPETCTTTALQEACVAHGGRCELQQDGYYIVGIASVVLGLLYWAVFLRRAIWVLSRERAVSLAFSSAIHPASAGLCPVVARASAWNAFPSRTGAFASRACTT